MKNACALVLFFSGISAMATPTVTNGKVYACTGLGNNAIIQVSLNSNNYLEVNNGGNLQVSTKQEDVSGSIAFTGFSAGGYIGATDVLTPSTALLSIGTGDLTWSMANTNGEWVGKCHLWTAADTKSVSCAAAVGEYASNDSVVTSKTENTVYEVSTPNAEAGAPFVYDYKTAKKGIFCAVTSSTPVSCPAVISDKIAARARQDGSSAGSPFVRKVSADLYTSGINDPESGEFIYSVTTVASGNSCKVTAIHKQ